MAQGKQQASGFKISELPQFISDSREELKKVTAPTRQETLQATFVTIFIVLLVAICLFLLDLIFHSVMGVVLG